MLEEARVNWWEVPSEYVSPSDRTIFARARVRFGTFRALWREAFHDAHIPYRQFFDSVRSTFYLGSRNKRVRADMLYAILRAMGEEPQRTPIESMGKEGAIRRPRAPFNLATPAGARIYAGVLNEGCVTIPRTTGRASVLYHNTSPQLLQNMTKAFREVFGEVRLFNVQSKGARMLATHNQTIAHALIKVGIPVGRLSEHPDMRLSRIISSSGKESAARYFRATFSEEGSVIEMRRRTPLRTYCYPMLRYRRSFSAGLTPEAVAELAWHTKTTPNSALRVINLTGIPPSLRENIKTPRLIQDERALLERAFGIQARLRLNCLYWHAYTSNRLNSEWELYTCDSENAKIYRDEIGFELPSKEARLRALLN